MRYVIPVVVEGPGTVVAVNVGGAIIPGLMSLYLLVKNQLWVRGLLATAGVATVCHVLAYPVPGIGIAEPVFVPSITKAVVALLLSRRYAAPPPYISGSGAPRKLASKRALDHGDFGLTQSKVMNVIDSKSLVRMRAENRFPLFLIPL